MNLGLIGLGVILNFERFLKGLRQMTKDLEAFSKALLQLKV